MAKNRFWNRRVSGGAAGIRIFDVLKVLRLAAWYWMTRTGPIILEWKVGRVTRKQKKQENEMLEITIGVDEKVTVTLSPKDHAGNPTKVDGKPDWTIVSGGATFGAISEDGLTAEIVSQDTLNDDPSLNDSQILVRADADLGAGVKQLSDSILLHVQAAQAENLGLALGTVSKK